MSYRGEIFERRGWDDVSDIRPSRFITPVVSPEAEKLAILIDTDPITAFTQMAKKVSSLPGRMFAGAAPVDLSLGNVRAGEALGSIALKMKIYSDSLGELVDFDGDLPEAIALAKRLKKGIFDAEARVAYYKTGRPLGIELGWESFDRIDHRGHVEAGKKAMSKNLFVALFSSMQHATAEPRQQEHTRRDQTTFVWQGEWSEETVRSLSSSSRRVIARTKPSAPFTPTASKKEEVFVDPRIKLEKAKERWNKKVQKANQKGKKKR